MCYLTGGLMTNKSGASDFYSSRLSLVPSKRYEYCSIDNAKHTRLIRVITRPTGGHACNWRSHVEQIKQMKENCKIPCRIRPCRLTHASRNYSSIYLAKVKFQRQFRGHVVTGKVAITSCFFLLYSVYQPVSVGKCVFILKYIYKMIWEVE